MTNEHQPLHGYSCNDSHDDLQPGHTLCMALEASNITSICMACSDTQQGLLQRLSQHCSCLAARPSRLHCTNRPVRRGSQPGHIIRTALEASNITSICMAGAETQQGLLQRLSQHCSWRQGFQGRVGQGTALHRTDPLALTFHQHSGVQQSKAISLLAHEVK